MSSRANLPLGSAEWQLSGGEATPGGLWPVRAQGKAQTFFAIPPVPKRQDGLCVAGTEK